MNLQFINKNKLKENNFAFSILLVIGFGILAMFPAYVWGIPIGADMDNHFRFVLPFYDEIIKGNYVPGWLAESNNNFGDARFRFYPPALYYLLCLFRFFTTDWYVAALAVITLFSVVGTLGVYFWAGQSLSNQTAVLAALIFAIVPYHLTQFYQASLLAEYAATALLPFAFMFVERLMTNRDRLNCGQDFLFQQLFNVAGLAVVYSLLITTHLPSTVIASLSLGIFALLLTDWKDNKKGLLFCALGIALGLISSSWYWIKMISELGWIQAGEKVSSPYYEYQNNFAFSPYALVNLNTWYASVLVALTIAIFSPSLLILGQILKKESINKNDSTQNLITNHFADYQSKLTIRKRLKAAILIAFLSLLMTTDLSRPFWAIIPKLKDVQFPYRWLTVASVAICPTVALSFQIWLRHIKQKRVRPVQLVLLLSFVIAVYMTIQDLVLDSGYTPRDKFLARIDETRGGRSFNDWLPRGARELKDLLPLQGQIDAGKRKVTVTNWQSQTRNFAVETGNESQARARSYYYPLWQAFIVKNGARIPTLTSQAEDGTLLIVLPPEAVDIELIFDEPPRTKISFIISIFGWVVILVLAITVFFRVKN